MGAASLLPSVWARRYSEEQDKLSSEIETSAKKKSKKKDKL